MAASATAQMTADRREVFIESSQFVCVSFAHWTRKVQMASRADICANSAEPTPRPDIHRFQTGPLSVNPKPTNDVPTRDGREQAPHLTLQRPVPLMLPGLRSWYGTGRSFRGVRGNRNRVGQEVPEQSSAP